MTDFGLKRERKGRKGRKRRSASSEADEKTEGNSLASISRLQPKLGDPKERANILNSRQGRLLSRKL